MNNKKYFEIKRKMVILLILTVFLQISGVSVISASVVEGETGATQDKAVIKLRNDKTVLVNGQKIADGASISSVSKIETLSGAEAEIKIADMGSLVIFPNSDVTLTYSGRNISVNVRKGCVSLFVNEDYTGILTLPSGKTETNSNNQRAELNSCDNIDGATGIPGAGGGVGSVGIPLPVLVASLIAGGIVTVIILTTRGEDASPMAP